MSEPAVLADAELATIDRWLSAPSNAGWQLDTLRRDEDGDLWITIRHTETGETKLCMWGVGQARQ